MKILNEALLVGAGGMLGALSRYGIAVAAFALLGSKFPWGTLVANVLGCFFMGFLLGSGIAESHPRAKLLIGIGFLGSLTTFSTFGAETVQHASVGEMPISVLNVIANMVLGIAAVVCGMTLGKRMVV